VKWAVHALEIRWLRCEDGDQIGHTELLLLGGSEGTMLPLWIPVGLGGIADNVNARKEVLVNRTSKKRETLRCMPKSRPEIMFPEMENNPSRTKGQFIGLR
jgi:putative methionine-R-sulfoxide reductase with GAF domain